MAIYLTQGRAVVSKHTSHRAARLAAKRLRRRQVFPVGTQFTAASIHGDNWQAGDEPPQENWAKNHQCDV